MGDGSGGVGGGGGDGGGVSGIFGCLGGGLGNGGNGGDGDGGGGVGGAGGSDGGGGGAVGGALARGEIVTVRPSFDTSMSSKSEIGSRSRPPVPPAFTAELTRVALKFHWSRKAAFELPASNCQPGGSVMLMAPQISSLVRFISKLTEVVAPTRLSAR